MQNVVDDMSLRLTAAELAQTDTVVLLRLDSCALERKVVCSKYRIKYWKTQNQMLDATFRPGLTNVHDRSYFPSPYYV